MKNCNIHFDKNKYTAKFLINKLLTFVDNVWYDVTININIRNQQEAYMCTYFSKVYFD